MLCTAVTQRLARVQYCWKPFSSCYHINRHYRFKQPIRRVLHTCHVDERWRHERWIERHGSIATPVGHVEVKQFRQGQTPYQFAHVVSRRQPAAILWPCAQCRRPHKLWRHIYVIEWHSYVRFDVIGWQHSHVTSQTDRKLQLERRYVVAIESILCVVGHVAELHTCRCHWQINKYMITIGFYSFLLCLRCRPFVVACIAAVC